MDDWVEGTLFAGAWLAASILFLVAWRCWYWPRRLAAISRRTGVAVDDLDQRRVLGSWCWRLFVAAQLPGIFLGVFVLTLVRRQRIQPGPWMWLRMILWCGLSGTLYALLWHLTIG